MFCVLPEIFSLKELLSGSIRLCGGTGYIGLPMGWSHFKLHLCSSPAAFVLQGILFLIALVFLPQSQPRFLWSCSCCLQESHGDLPSTSSTPKKETVPRPAEFPEAPLKGDNWETQPLFTPYLLKTQNDSFTEETKWLREGAGECEPGNHPKMTWRNQVLPSWFPELL
jgi:hypothetical protein